MSRVWDGSCGVGRAGVRRGRAGGSLAAGGGGAAAGTAGGGGGGAGAAGSGGGVVESCVPPAPVTAGESANAGASVSRNSAKRRGVGYSKNTVG